MLNMRKNEWNGHKLQENLEVLNWEGNIWRSKEMSYSYSRKAEIDLCNIVEVESRNSILEDGGHDKDSAFHWNPQERCLKKMICDRSSS